MSRAEVADRIRRSKKRSKYHELALLRYLKRLGWIYNSGLIFNCPTYEEFDFAGRRIPVSGPMFGWCDGFATKVVGDTFHIAFFQLKPRPSRDVTYFEKKQLISLCMLEELFKAPHSKVHKVLVVRLKRKWIFHEVMEKDLTHLDELTQQYKRPALFRLDRKTKSTWNPKLE